jgi:2-polyprenyl-3-methyl-5-hydroxy-6-metoxy-1,4-benzoquinol methylase
MPSAIQIWKHRIESHHGQTMKARGGREYPDMWDALAVNFKDHPHRDGDPIVEFVTEWLRPESTVLDVGGGAGRYALPFALRAAHVTNVEPSPSMVAAYEESAKEAGIENVSTVSADWEVADVEPADVVFCANVVYGVADIEPFVRKLEEKAREVVAIVVFTAAPITMFSPAWKIVHGETRIDLPALPELLPVLWEMGHYPNVQMMPEISRPAAPSMEFALAMARHMLYVEPGSAADERFLAAAPDLVEVTETGVRLRRAQGSRPAVVWWCKE